MRNSAVDPASKAKGATTRLAAPVCTLEALGVDVGRVDPTNGGFIFDAVTVSVGVADIPVSEGDDESETVLLLPIPLALEVAPDASAEPVMAESVTVGDAVIASEAEAVIPDSEPVELAASVIDAAVSLAALLAAVALI